MTIGMMNNRIYITLCLVIVSVMPTLVNAENVADLMQGISKNKNNLSHYIETKHAFYLDEPLKSEGIIEFRAPNTLIKKTIKPFLLTQVYSNNSIRTTEANGDETTFDLSSQPAIAILFQTLLGVITGNEKTIKENFDITINNKQKKWTIILSPKKESLKSWYKNIKISGAQFIIKRIKIVEANNDMTIMDLNEPS